MDKELKNKKIYKQYFTPRRIADFMVDFCGVLDPDLKNSMPVTFIDPACGEGVFISSALEKKITHQGLFKGIDKDETLIEHWQDQGLSSLYISDGLELSEDNSYSIVMGNPPYGITSINPKTTSFCESFELFNLYKKECKKINAFQLEVFFLEKFFNLAEDGGIIAAVLPVGIFTNSKMQYIRKWLLSRFTPLALIFIEKRIFISTGASARTALFFARKKKPSKKDKMLIASVMKVNDNMPDDLDTIADIYKKGRSYTSSGISAYYTNIKTLSAGRWDPASFNPEIGRYHELISEGGHKILPLSTLIDSGAIYTGYKGVQKIFKTPDECKEPVFFITSKNISNCTINKTSYSSYIEKGSPPDVARTRIKEGDILFVRSGEGCLGRAVVASKDEEGSNVRSEIYVMRPNLEKINPHYLAVFFNIFMLPFSKRERKAAHYAHFQFLELGRGVGTPNLSKDEILSLKIPVIPMNMQKNIEKEYKNVQQKYKTSSKAEADKLWQGLKDKVEKIIATS